MILKKISSITANLTSKTSKNKSKESKEPVSDKKPAEEAICSKNEADAIKAAFIGGQNSTIDITADSTESDEYYTVDEDEPLSSEEEEILHDMRTIGYVNSLLHQLYFNGCRGDELSIDEIAQQQAQEIIQTSDENELKSFICNIKEGMERINESASLMPPDITEELIQEGYTLCNKIIYLLENE